MNEDGEICGATVNWVTQTSFAPPLVVVGVKRDSNAHSVIQGDHSVVIAEVVEAGLKGPLAGRPDQQTLTLEDLGEKTFYGG